MAPPPSELAPAMKDPNIMVTVINQLSLNSDHDWFIVINMAHPNTKVTASVKKIRSGDLNNAINFRDMPNIYGADFSSYPLKKGY